MSTQRITALAAVFALALFALALGGTAALAQDDAQSRAGDGQQQHDQPMPRGGMMGPGQGQGMIGPGQGMMGPGQGIRGQGMMRGGQMRPGMMHGRMMHRGPMQGGPMQGGTMQGGTVQGGRANAGPTLKIETPGGLTFTCNAGMQACLHAFDRVRAANQGGDAQGN